MSLEKKEQYDHHRSEIEALLKQEITVNQELLSQLSQQEYLLLIGEVEMKHEIELEMSNLRKQQKAIQKRRKTISLEANPLDPLCDIDSEILFLLDTCHTLYEKIMNQTKRNRSLSNMIQKEGMLGSTNSGLAAHMIYDSKTKKPLLITLDYPEGKSE